MDKTIFETEKAYNSNSLKGNTPIMIIENEKGIFLLDLSHDGYSLKKIKMWRNSILTRLYLDPFNKNAIHYILNNDEIGNLYETLKEKGIEEIPFPK